MTIGRSLAVACAAFALSACAGGMDTQTAAWWRTTEALSGDDMEGRDTGSPGYDRAAAYVAERFERAGLRPAGDDGTYFQRISFRDIEVLSEGTTISINFANDGARPLRFLHDISVQPAWGMAERVEGQLTFRGYCAPSDLAEVRDMIVMCLGTRRAGQTTAASRLEAATAAGAAGLINIDDISFTQEPPRWPLAYARAVALADAPRAAATIPVMRMSAATFSDLADTIGVDACSRTPRFPRRSCRSNGWRGWRRASPRASAATPPTTCSPCCPEPTPPSRTNPFCSSRTSMATATARL